MAAADSTVTPTSFVNDNPLIGLIARASPEYVIPIKIKIERITPAPGPQDTFKGSPPTSAELAQLAANPAFQEAYRRNQSATLDLLRQVNVLLQSAGR